MTLRIGLALWTIVMSGAVASAAAEPAQSLPALALVPEEAVAFLHLPNLRTADDDLARFAERTGWRLGERERPILNALVRRTGIEAGLDSDGPAAVAFMDPKRYRGRYTLYVLPVADWDALLQTTAAEEMADDLYALTGTAGPRYVLRRGRFALVTSSVRTMDTVAPAEPILGSLLPETLARAAGPNPMLYVNVHRLTRAYESEIVSWFRAASGQLYYEPYALAYADMLITYMLGIADLIDQVETAEAAVRFGPEGLGVDLAVRFVEGASVAEFLSAQGPGTAPIPAWGDTPPASATTIRIDPETRTDFALRATRFFLEKAPRPEPLPEATKDEVYEAVQTFVESLGDRVMYLSSPAAPGLGVASQATVYELKDPEGFRKGVQMLAAAWERLADQLNLYLKIKALPDAGHIGGVPVTLYVPRFRFGAPPRHVKFRKWLQGLYGPEGLVYRVAVVGNKAVVGTGSDLALFQATVERLAAGKPAETPPAAARLQKQLPASQNVSIAMSLPLFLRQALLRGQTPPEQVGTADPGSELVGLSLRADGATLRAASYWPHEQLRLARELIERVAPEIAEVPESLFEPSEEGPPVEERAPAPAAPEPEAPEPAEPLPPEPEAPAE